MFDYVKYNFCNYYVLYYKSNKINYYAIHPISYFSKLSNYELNKIILEHDGLEVWDLKVQGAIIKFKKEEDIIKCSDYLNSILVLERLSK